MTVDNAQLAAEREQLLHYAVCMAVGMMNIGNHIPAHIVLRQALVDYADLSLQALKRA